MVCKVERRLCGIANFLNYGGKLELVKLVLSSLPLFYMSCLDILVGITEQIIKYMRHCQWRKKNQEVQAKGNALISWDKVCRPKDQGGLGVLNLQTQNKALLLMNLHKFYNKENIPWVNLIWTKYYASGDVSRKLQGSLWWKSHIKLIDLYKGIARCNLGDGRSALFWTDLWHDSCLHQNFPHLVTYAIRTDYLVSKVLQHEYI
jgi:hypothetical protein